MSTNKKSKNAQNQESAFTRTLEASSVSSRSERGFTLIELLVVIAIIGILSSVVLASLSGARQSAREASILSSLDNANTQATLYYNQNGSTYDGLCQDDKIQSILSSLRSTAEGAKCFEAQSKDHGEFVNDPATLARYDWGIAVKSDDNFYVGSPFGSGTFADSSESTGTDWQNAKSLCADAGGRLASPSAMAALWQLGPATDGNAPDGFAAAYHWSALESGAPSGKAWITGLYDGHVTHYPQSYTLDAHCVL